MKSFTNRPIVPLCAAYVLGIAAWSAGFSRWGIFLAVGILILAVSIARRSPLTAALIVGIGFLSAARCALFLQPLPNDVSHFATGSIVRLSGIVSSDPIVTERRFKATIKVDSIETAGKTIPVGGYVAASIYLPKTFSNRLPDYGDAVTFSGILKKPQDFWNPNSFSWTKYLASQRIFATISASLNKCGLEVRSGAGGNIASRAADVLREKLLARIYELFPGSAGKTVAGILLGITTELSPEDRAAFSRSGTYHLLAASGFNCLAITVVLGRYLFPFIGLHRRMGSALLIGCLIFYAMLSGGKPSIVRAAFMACLYLCAFTFKRVGDPLNIFATAALVMLIFDPGSFFDLSFRLSFAAAGSLMLIMPLISRFTSPELPNGPFRGLYFLRNEVIGASLATTAVTLGTLPITAQAFSQVSLVAIPANAIAALLTLAVFVTAPVALLLGNTPFLSGLIVQVAKVPAELLVAAVKLLGSFSYSSISVVQPHSLSILGYYSLLAAFIWSFWNGISAGKMRKAFNIPTAAAAIATIGIWVWAFWPSNDGLRVHFLDVGQGDCIVVQFPGGRTALIDTGPDTPHDISAAFLRSRGISTIDLMILTHPHADHIGETECILKNFRVRKVVSPFPPQDIGINPRIVNYSNVTAGKYIEFGNNCKLFFLAPTAAASANDAVDDNEQSLVAKIEYGETSILLCGDAGVESEIGLVSRGVDLEADILKVGHHGSSESASELFLREVKPKYAVISVGKWNDYGHPSNDSLERLARQNVEVLRTDYHSTITVQSDGKTVRITTARGSKRQKNSLMITNWQASC